MSIRCEWSYEGLTVRWPRDEVFPGIHSELSSLCFTPGKVGRSEILIEFFRKGLVIVLWLSSIHHRKYLVL